MDGRKNDVCRAILPPHPLPIEECVPNVVQTERLYAPCYPRYGMINEPRGEIIAIVGCLGQVAQ